MKYFKILVNDAIIGAITSEEFMRYLSITDCFVRATEQTGEYVTYEGKFYRATWMRPIVHYVDYTEALILAITKEEYDIFRAAIDSNETIKDDEEWNEPEEEPVPPVIDPIEVETLEFIRSSKINEMSATCRRTIESGFDLELRGETHHFSLTTQDQLNLMSLSVMAQTQDLIPYHADGEESTFYTAEEINKIVSAANNFKIYNTTYYNALKKYINALKTIEEISAIQYGIDIPEEYKTSVLKSLE